ncbi:hypothetical protein VTI28DRAFT_9262 [Corynascus sepedonium]
MAQFKRETTMQRFLRFLRYKKLEVVEVSSTDLDETWSSSDPPTLLVDNDGENTQVTQDQADIVRATATDAIAIVSSADDQSSSRQKQCQMPKKNGQICGKVSQNRTYCIPCRRKKSPLQDCKDCGNPSHGHTYCRTCRRKKSRLQNCKNCGSPSPGYTYCDHCKRKNAPSKKEV